MLHALKPSLDSTHRRKRGARGNSAGGGTTAGRGTKGQQSRTGKGRRFGFEGGQTPLLRRQPKMGGFKRPRRVRHEVLTLAVIERTLDAGTYTIADLRARRLLRTDTTVKLLGNTPVTKIFFLEVHAVSKGAQKAIESVGGTVTLMK